MCSPGLHTAEGFGRSRWQKASWQRQEEGEKTSVTLASIITYLLDVILFLYHLRRHHQALIQTLAPSQIRKLPRANQKTISHGRPSLGPNRSLDPNPILIQNLLLQGKALKGARKVRTCNVNPAYIIISFNGWVIVLNSKWMETLPETVILSTRISGILDKYIRILKDTFLFALFSKRRNLHQSHVEGKPNQLQKGLLPLHQIVIGEFGFFSFLAFFYMYIYTNNGNTFVLP